MGSYVRPQRFEGRSSKPLELWRALERMSRNGSPRTLRRPGEYTSVCSLPTELPESGGNFDEVKRTGEFDDCWQLPCCPSVSFRFTLESYGCLANDGSLTGYARSGPGPPTDIGHFCSNALN